MIAYKLFRLKKNGKIGSLFIDRKSDIIINEWLQAKFAPRKGFAPLVITRMTVLRLSRLISLHKTSRSAVVKNLDGRLKEERGVRPSLFYLFTNYSHFFHFNSFNIGVINCVYL